MQETKLDGVVETFVEKIEDWKALPGASLLSVCITTYNHEDFVWEAIEGVLMQETDFPFEVIIAEDQSTDSTRKIVLDYQQRHPDRIRVRLAKENLYCRNPRYPLFGAMRAARGKYVAICEGDDYWADPKKLQKQVDFLEAHPEYVLSHHDAKIVNASGQTLEPSKLPERNKTDLSNEQVMAGPFLLTLSLCYRNVLKNFPPAYFEVLNGDKFLISLLGRHGKARYQGEIEPGVYRTHEGGVWSMESERGRLEALVETYETLQRYHAAHGRPRVAGALRLQQAKNKERLLFVRKPERGPRETAAMLTEVLRVYLREGHVRGLFGLFKKASLRASRWVVRGLAGRARSSGSPETRSDGHE